MSPFIFKREHPSALFLISIFPVNLIEYILFDVPLCVLHYTSNLSIFTYEKLSQLTRVMY